ncbi:hypothetical protein [Cellvibrio sp. PSBB006]|uniref:hypothetical protein n=1 Tax=Cellvibrio sp. PSBB006 TaxID=1987723 RepID=UPI000B3B3977|nr:hypothetical protein [Cellvibrio sp. PSBB006]ARU27753.1 hypothetical protein CBR65_10120 [Cellvibrio sp. PSBB006]
MFIKSGHIEYEEFLIERGSQHIGTLSKKDLIMQMQDHLEEHRYNTSLILEHEENQYKKKQGIKEFDQKWVVLKDRTLEARAVLASGDINLIASTFYWLGLASAQLDQEATDLIEFSKNMSSIRHGMKSELALSKKNVASKFVRKEALEFANKCWKSPSHSHERIGKIAELTKIHIEALCSSNKEIEEIIDQSGYKLPRDINVIKRWLRPIAPKSAQARGRPKN